METGDFFVLAGWGMKLFTLGVIVATITLVTGVASAVILAILWAAKCAVASIQGKIVSFHDQLPFDEVDGIDTAQTVDRFFKERTRSK